MTISPRSSLAAVVTDAGSATCVAEPVGRFLTAFVACPACRLKSAMAGRTAYRCGGCGTKFTSHEGVRTYMELAR